MEANRLAEFRVRRREICLIVNSDDRRVGIYSLRGACVAAALRAARHKAQRNFFKKEAIYGLFFELQPLVANFSTPLGGLFVPHLVN